MVHAFYTGARIAVWSVYSVQLILYILQLYLDRKNLTNFKSYWKANRYFRIEGCIATVASLGLFIDAYGVHNIYSVGARLFFFLVLVWCCFSGVQVASYHSVIAVLPFVGYDKRERLVKRIRAVFVGYTIADFVATIVFFAVPYRVASLLALAVLASSNFPVIVGVHYVHYRLKQHHREMSENESIDLESSQTRKKQWSRVLRTWRNYAAGMTGGQLGLQVVLYVLIAMFASKEGPRNNVIHDVSVVHDPNQLPHFGLLVMPFLLNLISTAFLARSWIPMNASNWVGSTLKSLRASKDSDGSRQTITGTPCPAADVTKTPLNSRRTQERSNTLTKISPCPTRSSDEYTFTGTGTGTANPCSRNGELTFTGTANPCPKSGELPSTGTDNPCSKRGGSISTNSVRLAEQLRLGTMVSGINNAHFASAKDGGVNGSGNDGLSSSNGGFSSSNGGFSSSNGGFSSSNGGFSSSNGGFSSSNGGLSSSNGGFSSSNGGFSSSNGGFSSSNGGFSSSNGGFSSSNGGFASSNGGFSLSNGGFSSSNGGFSSSNGGFSSSNGFCSPNGSHSKTQRRILRGTFSSVGSAPDPRSKLAAILKPGSCAPELSVQLTLKATPAKFTEEVQYLTRARAASV